MKNKYYILSILGLSVFVLPLVLGLNAHALESFLGIVQGYDFSVMMISLGILLICLLLEILILGYRQSSLYQLLHPNKSVVTDIVIGLAYTLGIFFFLKTFFYLSWNSYSANPKVLAGDDKGPVFTWMYIPTLLFYLMLADFLKYIFHRLGHEFNFLWEIHKFHHSSTNFVLLTGNRVHPVEHILQKLFVTLPLVLIGIQVDMYLSLIIIMMFIDKLQHSMLDWNYGWIGKYLIYAPIGHRIHHSKLREHWDKNYGDLFVFWDRLFGTYYSGKTINQEVGVSDNWMNKEGLIYDLWHPLFLSFKALKQSLKTNAWRGEHLKNNKGSE